MPHERRAGAIVGPPLDSTGQDRPRHMSLQDLRVKRRTPAHIVRTTAVGPRMAEGIALVTGTQQRAFH